jgi:hypothetical protein
VPLGALLDPRRVGGHRDRDLVAGIAHHIEPAPASGQPVLPFTGYRILSDGQTQYE